MNNAFKTSLLALSISTILTACGGGGGSATGTPTNVTSSGTITEFGSVYVNGVRYETTAARIVSDDDGNTLVENPTDDQVQNILGLGNVVKIQGTKTDDSNGVATVITVDDELVGDVASIDDATGTFVVLGQTVLVSPDTIIDDSIIEAARAPGTELPNDLPFGDPTVTETLTQLLTGLTVQISGFPSANGIEATRIEDVNAADGTTGGNGGNNTLGEGEIKGFVSNLTAGSFTINGLTINYDNADLDSEDFASTALADGQFVEVHGTVSGTIMDATRIELENDGFDDSPEGEVEVEGIVTAIDAGNSTITINSIEIPVDDVTQFSVGMHIEIKAILQNGSLQVTRVQNEAEDTVRTEDSVISVDTGAGTATTRLGLVIELSDRSRLEDDTDTLGENPSATDFLNTVLNGRIEARGFPLNNDIVWTRAEISDDNKSDCRLRGPVANITGTSSFTIEGVTIDVSSSQFENASDIALSRQAFFDALSDGVIVEAKSVSDGSGCVSGNLTAREASLEPANDVLIDDSGVVSGNNGADNEVSGTVSNITATSFDINGETITVTDSTLIDASIVEDARNVELGDADLAFGPLPESLSELLVANSVYVVIVDRSNGAVATLIEDF